MQTLSVIDSWAPTSGLPPKYDCFVGTVGYETRARHFARKYRPVAEVRRAIGFSDRRVLAYAENLTWYREAGFDVRESSDSDFRSVIEQTLEEVVQRGRALRSGKPLRLCVDISSLSRFRLAIWIDSLRRLNHLGMLSVDFVYSAARFSNPPGTLGPNQEVGPLPGFAGWTEPALPLTVVVGVGYEHNKALGAVRYLDPEDTWAFIPTGHQPKYTMKINKANGQLWEMIPSEKRVLYDVNRPLDCLVMLESFICGVLRTDKVTLLPFGPKTFALCSLLVACIHTEVPVWRVSSGHHGEPSDRKPNGRVVGLRTEFKSETVDFRGR